MSAMPAARSGLLRAGRLACAAVVGLSLTGCAPGEAGGGDSADSAVGGEEPPDFEHLRALGYVDWDEGADETLSGVVLHERGRAAPGYNVYTDDEDEAYLCDLDGRRLHTWRLEGARHMETFELLEDGGIVTLSVGQQVARLDWDSRVVWSRRLPAHHDVTRASDGTFLALWWGREFEPYRGRRVRFDGIQRFTATGEPLERWSTRENLEALQRWHPPTELDTPPSEGGGGPPADRKYDYYHVNSLEVLPETPLGRTDPRFRAGNLLICLRNANVMCVLDGDTMEPVWSWGAGELRLPHMPTMLPSGNVLVFDNGVGRKFSRVVEVHPPTGEIVWSYEGSPRESFFSPWRGSAQRLANGNTLICEAERGHAFEVTLAGELVWEFWNPELVEGSRKRIYRFLRLAPELVEPILRARGVE